MSKFDIRTSHFDQAQKTGEGINLSALAVRERSVTLFFILAVIAAGAFAYFNLGRAEDPIFTIKISTVTAARPGATAQEMQDLVAEPLEKGMQELTYHDHVDTFTWPGLAFLTVNLKDYTPPEALQEQFYQGRKKIQDEAPKLPQGARPPILNDEYTDVVFAVYSLEAPGLPLRLLTREAESLREDLLHVPGVKKVNIFGERPERIFVQFSYDHIATLGVTARDIFEAHRKDPDDKRAQHLGHRRKSRTAGGSGFRDQRFGEGHAETNHRPSLSIRQDCRGAPLSRSERAGRQDRRHDLIRRGRSSKAAPAQV